ncbi:MAG: DUF6671 family protein [Phormidesmis sp.]
MSAPFFTNRTLVIATMHRKEQAIAPLIEPALGVKTLVPKDFNTDSFGTFTRERQRPADQLSTARLKAEAALKLTGETLAIASEGSFGPHPQIPFVACDRELVLLYDQQHQLEIVGEALCSDTNFQSKTVTSPQAAIAFAKSVGFPDHGMVVMPFAERNPHQPFAKGITAETDLVQAVATVLEQSADGQAHIETDMRALYNPTRMQAIAQATQDLLQKIEQRCPRCHYPGFDIVQRQPGLPCGYCQAPTLLTLSVLYRCQHCQFQQSERFPDSRQFADPARCLYCNP